MASPGSYVFLCNFRNIRRKMFYKKTFFTNFTKFARKHLCGFSFLIKLQARENAGFLELYFLPLFEKTPVPHSKQINKHSRSHFRVNFFFVSTCFVNVQSTWLVCLMCNI